MRIEKNIAYYRAALVVAGLAIAVIVIGALLKNAMVAGLGIALTSVCIVAILHFQSRLLLAASRRSTTRTQRALAVQTTSIQGQVDAVADAISRHGASFAELARDIEVRVAKQVPSVNGFDALQRKVNDLERILGSMESILIAEIDASRQTATRAMDNLQSSTLTLINDASGTLSNELMEARNQIAKSIRGSVDRANKRGRDTNRLLTSQSQLTRDQIAHAQSETQTSMLHFSELSESSSGRIATRVSDLLRTSDKSEASLDSAVSGINELKLRLDSNKVSFAELMSAVATSQDRTEQIASEAQTSAGHVARAESLVQQLETATQKIESSPSQDGSDNSDMLRRTINEGFRATRVALEQVPQSVDQYLNLRKLLAPEKLTMPPIGGWALTSTAITEVVSRILDAPDSPVVLELGSGVSTVWTSLAMQRRGGGKVVSLDHLEDYLEQTQNIVASDGLAQFVQFVHAPLVETAVGDEHFNWYDISQLDPEMRVDFLLIDGPPGSEGPRARYPALPLLADRLAPEAIILMDDTIRREEQLIIDCWLDEFAELSVERRLDKATVLKWSSRRAN